MLLLLRAEFQGFLILCRGDGKPLEGFKEECDIIEYNLYKLYSACWYIENIDFVLFVFCVWLVVEGQM